MATNPYSHYILKKSPFQPILQKISAMQKPLFYIKKDPAKTQGRIIHMERARRIELPYSAWEADVLPLNYARNCYFIIHHSRCRHKANDGKEIKKTCANRS